MNYEELMELIQKLDQSSVAFLDYQTANEHIVLAKEVPQMTLPKPEAEPRDTNQPPLPSLEAPALRIEAAQKAAEEAAAQEAAEKAGEVVEAPMVGVVYLQPHPEEEPYVQVGDRVERGDVVCIVEAMKLMNEIQSPYAGVVKEILVENEAVVEYKQPLIRIEQ